MTADSPAHGASDLNHPPPRVLVTGAGRGIGRATAIAFARTGAHVVVASRTQRELDETMRLVAEAGGTASCVAADLTADFGARRLAIEVERLGGELDALVNNAGLFRAAPFLETDVRKHYQDLIAANLSSTLLATLRLLPSLLRGRRPHVLNVLSVAALRGFPWNAGYAAAKWGARGFTESLRAEFGDRLRVTAVYPGATDTAAWDHAPFPHRREKMLRPEQVADAIVAAWRADAAPAEVVLETPAGAVGD